MRLRLSAAISRIGPVALGLALVWCTPRLSVQAAEALEQATNALPAASRTNSFKQKKPGPLDGQIAQITARLLEKYHYLRTPFDGALSSKFLDRYLEALDPQHLHFLQSDLADFEPWRTNLDRMITPERRGASPDVRPATIIFNRYVERLQQRVDYADELLKNEKFTFDKDEKVTVLRKDLPFPKDLAEAKGIWRDRLRYEYLQEKLGRDETKKKATSGKSSDNNRGSANKEPEQTATASSPKKTQAEDIVDTLSHRYHRNLHATLTWDSDDVLQIFLTALARVYDPHSDYYGKSALESFSIQMNLSLFGIGAELMSEDGYCTINRLLPNGPAEKSKNIKAKDRILAVAQSNQPPVDVVDMSLNKAVQLIRGPKGTEVRLTVQPAGTSERNIVSLTRDEIKFEDQQAKAKLIEAPGAHGETVRLGVIDLPSFYASFDPGQTRGKAEPKSTTADVSLLLKKLKEENVNGVILDLRRNGGGSLEEAIRLTGLFIKEGPVVQVKDYDNRIDEDDDTDPSVAYDGPLIVLTSRFSASASEIVAGALQDYGRAIIVGDSSTHGKGTVQQVLPLKEPLLRWLASQRSEGAMNLANLVISNDPGALKLTIKKFYRASGASTQLRGVVPDVVLPSVFGEAKEFGESALDNPMPWDPIDKAKYTRLNLVDPYVGELRRLSTKRIASDKEYSYIREDIDYYRKQQADKTVSLNEAERLKEKQDLDARLKARDKERATRPDPFEKVYELTLKQAALPGLPAPLSKTNTLAKVSGGKDGTRAGVSTNGPIASTQDGIPGLHGEDPDEEKAPTFDAPLIEAEHIMLDYVSMAPKGSLFTAGK